MYKVFMPLASAFQKSLKGDAVPKAAPVDFNPKAQGRVAASPSALPGSS
jgi:hypothetical protein